jgi:hypothetical protein
MKKKLFYLVVLALLSVGTVYGQFVVTSYYNPRAGETQTLIYGDTSAIFPGNGGANQMWSYPVLINLGDSSISTYILPSATPYSSSFPTATIANYVPTNPNSYAYYSGTDTSFELLGNQSSSFKTVYSNPKRFRIYPLNYLQSFTDTYKAITYQGTNIVQRLSGTITVTYDGYGTLTLPTGTVTNVGRFKFTSYDIDTMTFGSTTTIEYIKDTTWMWAKSNFRYGLFEIEKSWMSMDGISFNGFKWVGFTPNINSVGVKILTNEVPANFKLEQNYPNPFNPATKIRYQVPKGANVTLKIYDALGREVETLWNSIQNAGIYEINWDAKGYSSGVYYCRMTSEGFSETKQIVLVK